MNFLKRFYVLPYLAVLFVVFMYSLYQVILLGDRPMIFLLVATAPMLFFMLALVVFDKPRTKNHLIHELVSGVVVSLAALYYVNWQIAAVCFVLGVLGVAAYDFWYSALDRQLDVLQSGKQLPAISFWEDDHQLSFEQLVEKPAVWLFVRGNWCPLCVAQVKELADSYKKIAHSGAEVFVISAQSQKEIRKMASSLSVPIRFLQDKDLASSKKLGVVHEGGLPVGMLGYEEDTIMPTVLITQAGGEIYYSDQTSNYRVRPEPEALLAEIGKMINNK